MTAARLRIDVFCKVVDNYGDAGVSWRLARILAGEHGADVTLWLDGLASLSRIAPGVDPDAPAQTVQGVSIRPVATPFPDVEAADVVIDAFGAGLPAAYVDAMARRTPPPPWFILEYLTAERWIEGTHGRPSPHPHRPLARWFWCPGFTARTGGLLRERNLFALRDAFQADPAAQASLWARLRVPPPAGGETRVSLFCYPHPGLPALLDAWADGDERIVCVVPEGVAAGAIDAWSGGALPHAGGPPLTRGRLSLHVVPFVAQDDYDRLLWASHVNFVRGEDSFVRAQYAARPFVWHLYPQAEDAHRAKLAAFLDLYAPGPGTPSGDAARQLLGAWNGAAGAGPIGTAWLAFTAVRADLASHGAAWARHLSALPELADGLVKAAHDRL